jgi:hypothetical protein
MRDYPESPIQKRVPVAVRTRGVRVEQHISPGDLPVQLSHGALMGGGGACQFIRIDGTTLCHGPVKTELVPKAGHDTSHGGCEIGHHLTGELLEFSAAYLL